MSTDKLEKKIEKKQKLNDFLTQTSNMLDNKNKLKEESFDGFWMPWEKELMKKKEYEPIQLDEEELEDDSLYEKGED